MRNVISSSLPKKLIKVAKFANHVSLRYIFHATLASVLSSSLSTEHHKAGAGERSILGDRNKRGWQLKQKTKATLFYDA